MPQVTANFAKAWLVGTINAADTQLTIESARADKFPVGTTANWGSEQNWFKLVLQDAAGNYEIIYAGVRASGSAVISNLQRAREGTTARNWTATETIVANRPTALDFAAAFAALTEGGTVSTNAQNFNTLTQRRIYLLTGNGTWTGSSNSPASAPANGILTVVASGDGVLQELVTHTPQQVWHRVRTTDANWGAWKRADAYDTSAFMRTVLDNASAEAARTTLGAAFLGGLATQAFAVGTATEPQHAVRMDQLTTALLRNAPTGAILHMQRASTPPTWVALKGGTIGSAASGATERAHADTQALFEEIWGSTAQEDAPVFTSAGAATARGASASADFAANKRIQLLDMRFRYLIGLDSGLGLEATRRLGSVRDGAVGDHEHANFAFDSLGQDTGNGRPMGTAVVGSDSAVWGPTWVGGHTGGITNATPHGPFNLVRDIALPGFQKL